MDIWDAMKEEGMIDAETWRWGKNILLPYFGQDFGGGEDDVAEDEQGGQGGRRIVSSEFVYDSSE